MEDNEWTYPFDKPHNWDWRDEQWHIRYLELKAYKKEHGDCKVPNKWAKNKSLGLWVGVQRTKKEKMASWRKELLDNLGFTWRIVVKSKSLPWQQMYHNLCHFKEKHGHCIVPSKGSTKRLGLWVFNQRAKYQKGLLSQKQVSLLEHIGFEWSRAHIKTAYKWQKDLWELRFKELKAFKLLQGHCNVGKNDENKSLAYWVGSQRTNFNKNTISPERRKRLEALGFEWDRSEGHRDAIQKNLDQRWLSKFKQLELFKQQHGHCNVSSRQEEFKILAFWVARQRRFFRNNTLRPDRIQLLDSLDFEWNRKGKAVQRKGINTKRWMMRYQQLVDFRNAYGSFAIPNITEFFTLRNWLFCQRGKFKQGKLPQELIDLLEALDPAWKGPNQYKPAKNN